MKRLVLITVLLGLFAMTTGCANFWNNYYSIQPGITRMENVEKLLGKPFVKGDGKWVYQSPKADEGDFQNMEIFFDEHGVVTSMVRTNPRLSPPPGLDGQIQEKETIGATPPFTPGSTKEVHQK